MEVGVVVDDVFAEESEQSAGTVVAAELGAVELELCLAGDMIGVCGGDDGGKSQGLCDAAKGDGAVESVVGVPGVQDGNGSA